ncbi:uncharacterized protein RCC_01905 [Ramularia collo-cygni]|uniref:Ribonuclease H2 subunit B n=1 Tax=Ramularia collo-cygni TaxID=112498 RepID=A0A2D3URD7_9PEZI|nr:uncharacterized protein RCC_01905 [Ramularia collo-cygni]CZT16065.1 uncharacterized protein RCC_01905 [Ramularia collo-cygni]
MPKTRSKPGNATPAPTKTKVTLQSLETAVECPPHLLVLPKHASSDARIVTINSSRYFICPTTGVYEFTHISAPKATPRSWLLAPHASEATESGYLLEKPSLLLATPIDPLFLLLPHLAADLPSFSTEYLAPSDFLDKLSTSAPHLSHLLHAGNLPTILAHRIEAVSDCMDMGDGDRMYALSLPKLVAEIVHKARRMASKPLPKSMEERFVKDALYVPVLSIKREESGMSIQSTTAGAEMEGNSQSSSSTKDKAEDSQNSSTRDEKEDSQSSSTRDKEQDSQKSLSTTATSTIPSDPQDKDMEIANLLRLRTSLDFLLKSYIPSSLFPLLEPLISALIDWSSLTAHLARLAALKKEAQSSRSIGDSFSRKRVLGEDEQDKEDVKKKRKKEEEAKRKKSVGQGIKKLAKVDRTGMKSLSTFFAKK